MRAAVATDQLPLPIAREMTLRQRLRTSWRRHFPDARRERLFLSSLGFLGGASAARLVTHLIHNDIGPFRNVTARGHHLHHLVFGISALLGTGYAWLVIAGDADRREVRHRATAVLFGTGSALTLDEFALWLNLRDVYWAPEGRESVEALLVFGSLLSVGAWGGPFLRSAATDVVRPGG